MQNLNFLAEFLRNLPTELAVMMSGRRQECVVKSASAAFQIAKTKGTFKMPVGDFVGKACSNGDELVLTLPVTTTRFLNP